MTEEKKLTVLDYPECIPEIIKYMDFLPDDDAQREAFIRAFVSKVTTA